MFIPNMRLKSQLVIVNTLSKALIILILFFTLPWLVSRISINQTDDNLIEKLDELFVIIDSVGIDAFFSDDFGAFGSYNILKEEYISLEHTSNDTLINYIASSQRLIEDQVVDYRVLSYSFEYEDEFYLIEIGKSIETIYSFERQLKNWAIIFMLILLAVTIILEVSLFQILLQPLDVIIKKLAKNNHPTIFKYDKTSTSTADFILLEETLHTLMHKIEETFHNEREYISNVSHELLTPISIIKSKLDNLMMEGNLNDDDMVKVFESKQTLGRLTKIIRTLLMLSRIENDEYILKDEVNVVEVLKQVIDELNDKVSSKGLVLNSYFAKTSLIINGNRELVFILFYNILNNAIKYTEKGIITLNNSTQSGNTLFTITDTGTGIDAAILPQIFTRFGKFKSGGDSFGLGLALAKKIADYHNIAIEISSESQKGTTVFLTFKS